MPAGTSVDRLSSASCVHSVNVSYPISMISKTVLDADISRGNQDDIVDAEGYITRASRESFADCVVDSEEGDEMDVMQLSTAELQEQVGQQFIEGMNPYVEELQAEEEGNVEEHCNDSKEMQCRSLDKEKELTEWENPSYLVKDLDTGESYRVEEIDQQFTLVTLDSVAAQHEEK